MFAERHVPYNLGQNLQLDGDFSIPSREVLVPVSLDEDGLPPVDKGRAAWSLLLWVSLILMITWGFGSASGVFREYYFQYPPTAGNQLIASIGSLVVGVLQALSPFMLHYLSGREHQRKPMMWVGAVMVVAATFGAAFSVTSFQVILTQGFLYGIGSGLLFAPSVSFIDEWFLERRGFANGLYFGSNNIAAAAFSPVFSAALERFGSRMVLISWAILAGFVMTLSILLVRPRQHTYDVAKTRVTWAPLKKPLFWIFSFSMVFHGLSNSLPAAYLPSYAADVGVSNSLGSLLVTYLSLAGMIGPSLLGLLTDRVGAPLPLLLSTLVSSLAVVLLWGLEGQAYWALVLFAVFFGAFSFGFVVLRSHMAAAVVGSLDRPNEETVVSGALMCVRGLSTVASGYMSASIMSANEHLGVKPGFGVGKWRALIIALSCLMFGASLGAIGFLKKERRLMRR